MLKARFHKHILHFSQPAGTSRGILQHKTVYYLLLQHTSQPRITGIGECGLLPGLSFDEHPDYEMRLSSLCSEINETSTANTDALSGWPSIRFALEMALYDLMEGGKRVLFDSSFTRGEAPISINGLIWMGNEEFMAQQIENKLEQGFHVLKMKIGAINFETEISMLRRIRQRFNENEISLRLDANGAFNENEALEKLKRLAEFGIHSIEQPIKAGNPESMAALCKASPIPIALDEELIGVFDMEDQTNLLKTIRPAFIILKPTLLGGFEASHVWIDHATRQNIGWWITSALESNIGLNAIAQWTATLDNPLPQGLGTGSLYTNNVLSPLQVENGHLHFREGVKWDLSNTGIGKQHMMNE